MRRGLAHASWMIPVAAMGMSKFLAVHGPVSSEEERGQLLGGACVQFLAYIMGLAIAIIALRSRDPREGEKTLPPDIKIPALCGLILNGLLVAAMIVAVVAAVGSVVQRNAQ